MKVPMHKHRPSQNKASIKTRLAASRAARIRSEGKKEVTMPKPPWEAEGKDRP